MNKGMKIAVWAAQIIVAGIFIQSLFFKFTGAQEAIALFTTLGVEPWGRILTGVLELISAVLLFIPAFALYGAMLAALILLGAIVAHVTILGIVSNNDGGLLFGMAVVALLLSSFVIYVRGKRFRKN